MKLKKNSIALLILILGLGNCCIAQNKESQEQLKKEEKLNVKDSIAIKNSNMVISVVDHGILNSKEILFNEYLLSDKCDQKESQPGTMKQILNVGWFDTSFNKISSTVKGELISISVLTKGYKIGEKVEVTMGGDDDESMIEGIICSEITFIGYVNYENLAFLKDIFTVEGEKEQLNISSDWKDRYICK